MDILKVFGTDDLSTRYAVDEKPDDRYFEMHIHEQCEILYFISGNAEYLVEGSRYPLEPRCILIMRPSESHRMKILKSDRYERYVINFSVAEIDAVDAEHRLLKAFFERSLGRGNYYSPAELDGTKLDTLLDDMCSCAEDEYGKRLKTLINLFAILDTINIAYLKRDCAEYPPPQNLSEKIVSYVNKNLLKDISIPTLAREFFLSTSQFSRIFKQATGAAPWEYITIKRLITARDMIRNGSSAQAASESCGFGNYSAFYRSYVKHFGNPPTRDMYNYAVQ